MLTSTHQSPVWRSLWWTVCVFLCTNVYTYVCVCVLKKKELRGGGMCRELIRNQCFFLVFSACAWCLR